MKKGYLLIAVMLIYSITHAQTIHHNMNKKVVTRLYEAALNNRNMAVLSEIISADYINPTGVKGPGGFEAAVASLFKSFPDIQWQIKALTAEGDKVIVEWQWQGTHLAEFQHYAPTGKKISNNGLTIYLLKEGKIIHSQVMPDRLGFLQDIEVLPADLAVLAGRKSKDKVSFIDKFFVPAAAKASFYERMEINRKFIRQLPGFIEDAVYEYTDKDGNLICITVAQWMNREAFEKAGEAVRAEYHKQGFDAAAMFRALNITADRGVYTER